MLSSKGIKAGDAGATADYYESWAAEDWVVQNAMLCQIIFRIQAKEISEFHWILF